MPHVKLDHISVDFTIYQMAARSWRQTLFRASVGGIIGHSHEKGRMTIKALQGINIDLRSGCRLALLGHNGAGKTTLLRAIAGIYEPSVGRIDVDGRRVPLFDIGLGFDEEATGLENIILRGLLMGLGLDQIKEKVPQISEFSGLGDFLNLPVRTYSTGMTMRLMFSIATSIEADIVLMDEWIATGDQEFVDRANQRLNSMIDRSHILIFASHNLELLRSLCNRALVLDGGRVSFDGSVDSAIEHYQRAAMQ